MTQPSSARPVETILAPAKLTVSLRITGVRDDGLHVIDAEMVTLDLVDELHIGPGSSLTIEGAGSDVDAGPDNLVNRALELAGREASVHLVKRIPSQAGLGGGSADAAAILRWAGFDDLEMASRLGADIAFCLVGGRARVRGIGEIIDPLPPVDRTFTLVTPPLLCPTPAVYRVWDELGGPTGESANDLEDAALVVQPELARWRDEFAAATGERPTLAGSGSSWFVPGAHPGAGRTVVRTTRQDGA
ncbi:MAG: 4-(cytidine 5'-diphospho)-2-C-methyl-D-erythritol kinase [Actinomycetia bacterium]|nr:4-(cytidine 5'-diphospho)-2-C-methyl-D-erythritol kinase [Actinomycetes bacterium]